MNLFTPENGPQEIGLSVVLLTQEGETTCVDPADAHAQTNCGRPRANTIMLTTPAATSVGTVSDSRRMRAQTSAACSKKSSPQAEKAAASRIPASARHLLGRLERAPPPQPFEHSTAIKTHAGQAKPDRSLQHAEPVNHAAAKIDR